MFFIDLVFVLILTVLFTAIFAAGFRRQTGWDALLLFFILLFLMTWAFGGWIPPFGPMLWGVVWSPFLITGLLIALLLTVFIEPRAPRTPSEKARQQEEVRKSIVVLDTFFWILLIGLLVVIIVRYVF